MMKVFVLFASLLVCCVVTGCGSEPTNSVVETLPETDAEAQKRMEDYDKEMDAGN